MAVKPQKIRGDDSQDDRPVDPSQSAPDGEKNTAPAAPTDDDEVGGPKGPEPTRFGDWERKGRCVDF